MSRSYEPQKSLTKKIRVGIKNLFLFPSKVLLELFNTETYYYNMVSYRTVAVVLSIVQSFLLASMVR